MDKRWQMVPDCLGAEHPPFSQGTLFNFRMRLITHNLDKTLLDRTVALAEHTGGFRARQLRGSGLHAAVRRFWPGRRHVEPARPCAAQGGGLAAQALDTSAEVLVEDVAAAGGTQQSQSGTGPGLGSPAHAPARWAWS